MYKKILSVLLLLSMLLCAACAHGEDVVIPKITTIYQQEIPDNEAMTFVKNMGIGWNLGNTFDAINDYNKGDDLKIESSWVGVKTTEDMIDAVHKAGFNTLRLPVSWHNHVEADFNINTPWLDRVQEVVDWAVERDMYVILNTHHDVYPEYYFPTEEHYATAEKYITAIWSQLAERFKDYDHHLIFESMNEPRPAGTSQEWWFNQEDPYCVEVAGCINRLNQAFVNTVRASGSQNADRYLMVPAYCANPDAACNTTYFHLPTDTADNRIIVSAHAYTPYSFALEMPGTSSFNPVTNAGQLTEIIRFVSSLHKTYVTNGIPVVIGEYGAMEKNGNLQDRVNFYAYYVATASSRNIPCVVWDNHVFKGNGERFGLLDRKTLTWPNEILIQTMMQYAGYDKLPAKK
ncbi:MAG: glycoside hydrolase family 5 protein [Clostridiales bacterium]|nr:glycoside hydrolase family 5 protein [Clostridiales bacterium]